MKIIACGDIALCNNVEKKILQNGSASMLPEFRDKFQKADLFLANIEVPITDTEKPAWSHFRTLKACRKTGKFIGDIGVDVASLANNHIADYGREGLADTMAVLEEQKIIWLGAGWDPEEARRPLVIEKGGYRIGILALAQPEISAAWKGKWGAGVLEDEYAIKTIREMKEQTDFCICYLHFGVEFCNYPTPHQVRLSRKLIDEGALLVIGHHPHVPQGYEYYKNGFIAYSLGNFLFDLQLGSHKFASLGILIEADIQNGELEHVKIIPVDTRNGETGLLEADQKKEAKEFLKNLSKPLSDQKQLDRRYYFTCRDNLQIHLQAFWRLIIKQGNFKRLPTWVDSQFWPQIRELRTDLLRFVITGKALRIEKDKGPPAEGMLSIIWRLICYTGWLSSFFINPFLKPEPAPLTQK